MATEIELKYKIPSSEFSELKDKLAQFESKGRKYEKNIMFDNEQQSMQKLDARLRVRLISEDKDDKEKTIEIAYKRRLAIENGIKKEEEIEVDFKTEPEIFILILNKMGYFKTTSYERYRETIIVNNTKVTIDEFPYGMVLEIEGEGEEIKSVAQDLDLKDDNLYSLSCDDLYIELCRNKGIVPKRDILFDDLEMPNY